jgi:hypothetical protein
MSPSMSLNGKRVSARRNAKRSSASSQKELLIDSLNPHDVVLGRGQHVQHQGNTRFRTLVRSRAAEYHACASKPCKDVVARQIVRDVEDLGGRFVKRTERNPNGGSTMPSTWEIVDHSHVLVKVKQTFRGSVVQRKAASAAATAAVAASASSSSGTHNSIAPSLQQLAVRPNDQEPPAVPPPSSLNNSAYAFNQPGVPSTHPNLIAQQDQSNTDQWLSMLANQPLTQQFLSNYTTPAMQSGPALQSAPSPNIGSDIFNASHVLRCWTPEQLAQLQTMLWRQILSNEPSGQIGGGWSDMAQPPMSSALYQSLLGPTTLASPLLSGTNWGLDTPYLSWPFALSPTSNNALTSWNAALGGASLGGAQVSVSMSTSTGHAATATDQSSGVAGSEQSASARVANV